MPELRMVRLHTASGPMEARILAARLGAEGVVWQLRGSVDGPLAIGPVDVLVDADAYETAQDVLSLSDDGSARGAIDHHITWQEVVMVAGVIALLALFAFVRMAARV